MLREIDLPEGAVFYIIRVEPRSFHLIEFHSDLIDVKHTHVMVGDKCYCPTPRRCDR